MSEALTRVFVAGLVLLFAAAPSASATRLDDVMIDMNITPVEPQAPPPLNVEMLGGGRVTLADVKGHVVLVYFWATW
jgi:cytochrome oxidase Cu insertion factor (SCO1/SenC/PrrC family)